jgi:putative ABC transport system ATP-binding protein
MPDAPLIVVDHVSKYYPDGQVHALADVSLSFRSQEYVAIMGPSGSGKSTLLNLLGGLDQPTSGSIRFQGKSLAETRDLDNFRAMKIGFVFQSFFLLPTLNALENVQIPMFESPLPARQRAPKALELLKNVGMAHRAKHLPSQLSVGERQRVAVARSLANDPLVLLADEPTGNLDSHNADEILDLFDKLHNQRPMTLIVITHDVRAAQRAQRTINIRDGKIVP